MKDLMTLLIDEMGIMPGLCFNASLNDILFHTSDEETIPPKSEEI